MTDLRTRLERLRDELADTALESATEGGGFIERPYTRYRYHNGYVAGADAFIPMIVELQQALWLVASYRGNTICGYTPDEDLAIEDALSRTADVADEALANLEKFLGDKNE